MYHPFHSMINLTLIGGEDVSARIEFLNKLSKLNYRISIIGSEEKDRFQKNNIEYFYYQLNRELDPFGDIRAILQLRRILKRQQQTTIVHAFDTKPAMLLPIASIALENIKVIRTITGMGRLFSERSFKNKILSLIYVCVHRLIKKKVDFSIFQNDDDHCFFLENHLVHNNNSCVIKSSGINLKKYSFGIDKRNIEKLKQELSIDSKNPTLILVSRMIKQKGILEYLEAAKLCKQEGYNFNFLLVGQIDSNEDAISKEKILSYADYVSYLGRREDIKELLSLSDIFVFPSYYREGIPRVLLEASAIGLALITTDMPGCRDVVKDDFNGRLVKIKDPKDLSNKMIELAQSRDKIEKYSRNGKMIVKNFDIDLIVRKYDEIYRNI